MRTEAIAYSPAVPRTTCTGSTLRTMLRQATRPDHEALDRAFTRFDLDTHAGYCAFLAVHLGALSTLRDACDVAAHDDVRTLIGHLARDLARMSPSVQVDAERPGPVTSRTRFERAGTTYVIRGSRLGAVFVRKQVHAGFPTDYLGGALSLSWPGFVAGLDALGTGAHAADIDGAVESAHATFACFAAFAARG